MASSRKPLSGSYQGFEEFLATKDHEGLTEVLQELETALQVHKKVLEPYVLDVKAIAEEFPGSGVPPDRRREWEMKQRKMRTYQKKNIDPINEKIARVKFRLEDANV